MGKQFRKYKMRMWVGAILRAIAFAIFLGTTSQAAQWIYAKQTLSVMDPTLGAVLIYVPALLGGVVLLLIYMPRNKALAKRLDTRLGLDEKVQTMVALRKDPSEMAAFQRESAEEALAKAPRRRITAVASWIFLALPLVGALAIYGALVMPARALPTPPEEQIPVVGWQFDIYTEQKLLDLIDYVEKSDMEEEPRAEVVGELEGLIIRLRPVTRENVMKEVVLQTASNIHEIVSDYNTYDVAADALMTSSEVSVRRLGNSIRTLKYLLINEQLLAIGEALTPSASADPTAPASVGRGATAVLIAAELKATMARSDIPESDPLHAAILAFAADLEGVTDETKDDEIEDLITRTQKSFQKALDLPLENEIVETATLTRLMAIFGLELPEELVKDNAYDPIEDDSFNPDDDDDKDISEVGGIGSGEVHYGSNDTIYDDMTGEYVTYGDILARCYTAVMGQVEEGTLPADLEDMIRVYFERLHSAEEKDAA